MFKKIAASSIAVLLAATPHAAFAQEAQPVKVGDHLVLKLKDGKTHLCSPGLLVGNVLLTAGHCGPAGTPVFDENDNQLGTIEYFPDNPYDKESTAANDKAYVKLNTSTSREGGPVDPKNLEPYYGPIDKDNDEVCAWSTMANEERCGKIVGMYPGSIDYNFTMIKGDSGTAVYIKGKGTIATHGVSNHENGTAYGSLLPAMDVINEVTHPEGVPPVEGVDDPAVTGTDNPVTESPDTDTNSPVTESPDTATNSPVTESPDTATNTSVTESPDTATDNPVTESPDTATDNPVTESPDTATNTPAPESPEKPTTLDPQKVYEQRVQPPAPDAKNNYAVGVPEDHNPTNTETNHQRTLAATGANVLTLVGIATALCIGAGTMLLRTRRD